MGFGDGVLRMGFEHRVIDAVNRFMSFKVSRDLQRRGTGLAQAQRQRLGTDADLMRLLRAERAAHVAQAFFADLLQAPAFRIALSVIGKNVGVRVPVEQSRIRHRAAQRRTVACDGFGQRVDDQRRIHQTRLEQVG